MAHIKYKKHYALIRYFKKIDLTMKSMVDRRKYGIEYKLQSFVVLFLALFALGASGCASNSKRINPLPFELSSEAKIPNIPNARYWGDEIPAGFNGWLNQSEDNLKENYGGIMNRQHNYLVISGGGEDGAYGAGVLLGWTATGTRPEFQIVTGVSTGALIAPFAFLGSEYDKKLKEIYTNYSAKDIILVKNIISILSGHSAADTMPLKKLLEKYIDDTVVNRIAQEGKKGRSLLIGTTNLDANRPVTWDLTRIAMSGAPNAKKLIQQVMLASASIPGAFPPILFDVEVDSKKYQEIHVDGGVSSQLFLSARGLDWKKISQRLNVIGTPQVYVIRNSKLTTTWKETELSLLPILSRSITSLIRTQGIGDLAQIYILAQRDRLGYNIGWIPSSFNEASTAPFDKDYMNKLFNFGFEQAINGYPWLNKFNIPEIKDN